MKLKYYLRGLGIGIVITTIVLMIAYSGYREEMSDAEIIARAEAMGMVKKEESLFPNLEKESEMIAETEQEAVKDTEKVTETEKAKDTEIIKETEKVIETEKVTETEKVVETEKVIETEKVTDTETVPKGEIYRLIIPAGSVPRLICQDLEENGVIASASELRQYLVEVGYATSIVAGEYEVPYGATNDEVYQILKAGPIRR